jgi:arginine-tRNA-protein transferase
LEVRYARDEYRSDFGGIPFDERRVLALIRTVRTLLEDTFVAWEVPPHVMDGLWAAGWWHLGPTFFRRAFLEWRGRMEPLLHLRIDLQRFELSRSQRRTLRRNASLRVHVKAAEVDDTQRDMFDRHRLRFAEGAPESLDSYLGPSPATKPVPIAMFRLFDGSSLIAASYLAQGTDSVASLYGIFEPNEAHRRLGICTMLLEIEHARQQGFRYYYPGYALVEASCLDYKKQFHGLEAYEWNGGWSEFPRLTDPDMPSSSELVDPPDGD